MNEQVERAVKSLFASEGVSDVNIKFFLGFKRGVTGAELADQLNRADSQVRNGLAARSVHLDGELTTKTF